MTRSILVITQASPLWSVVSFSSNSILPVCRIAQITLYTALTSCKRYYFDKNCKTFEQLLRDLNHITLYDKIKNSVNSIRAVKAKLINLIQKQIIKCKLITHIFFTSFSPIKIWETLLNNPSNFKQKKFISL